MIDKIGFEDVINIKHCEIAWKQLKNTFRKEIIRDPFEYLDYEVHLEENLWSLVTKVNNHSYIPKKPIIVQFAKSKGLYRPVAILDVEDLILYQAIIIKIAPTLDKLLSDGIFAARATGNNKNPFKGWYKEWPKYQRKLRVFKDSGYDVLVITDISAYFENIDHGILKDIILQNQVDKKLVDLLFFMLETWTHRPEYCSNLYRGIPQTTNQECSNFLSNIFLHQHDKIIDAIPDSEYTRWIDDMNIAVKTEISGKSVLNQISGTLRDLYLYPNTGKTEILKGDCINVHFFFDENDYLDTVEKKIKALVGNKECLSTIENELIEKYTQFRHTNNGGVWFKVLKRYYTVFTRIRSNHLVDNFADDLKNHPMLDEKICLYLLALDYSQDVICKIMEYIKSDENLYESVEMHLLELLLNMRVPLSPKTEKRILTDFGKDIFNDGSKHWYSRAIAALIITKYGFKSDIRKLAKNCYTQYGEEAKLRKYLVSISTLLGKSDDEYEEVIKTAKVEYPQDIHSLIGLIELIETSSGTIPEIIKKKLILDEIHLPDVKIKYMNIRVYILLNLLSSNLQYYPELKPTIKKLMEYNSDPIMYEKLKSLQCLIS